jgi:PAS domain S-box-containing protein
LEDGHHAGSAGGLESDRRYRLLVDSITDYAIFIVDPGGHVVTWNAGAQRIKGYTADEIIGKHF